MKSNGMVSWTHPVFGTYEVFVDNKDECNEKDFEELFDSISKRINDAIYVTMVDGDGNPCCFGGDRVREGFVTWVKGK